MAAGAYNGNAGGVIQTLVVLEQARGAERTRKPRARTAPAPAARAARRL